MLLLCLCTVYTGLQVAETLCGGVVRPVSGLLDGGHLQLHSNSHGPSRVSDEPGNDNLDFLLDVVWLEEEVFMLPPGLIVRTILTGLTLREQVRLAVVVVVVVIV
jgi:hypothetical protein